MSNNTNHSLIGYIPNRLELSNLDRTSKDCINEVFKRYNNLLKALETIEAEALYEPVISEFDDGMQNGLLKALEILNTAINMEK